MQNKISILKNPSTAYVTETPPLTAERFWRPEDVRIACIRNGLYNYGTVQQYEKMLAMVQNNSPTIETIYLVAKDIFENSAMDPNNGQTISNIMYILESETVHTTFLIDGREDI